MKIRLLDSSFVVDFIGEGFGFEQLLSMVKSEVEKIAKNIKTEKLQDWGICFRFYYNNVKGILIYTKGRADITDKYKEITVHIPIPIKDKVAWGVDLEQHAYKDENHLENLMKNFACLTVDYSNFENRQDYILDCMIRTVRNSFEKGFSINGIKIKL